MHIQARHPGLDQLAGEIPEVGVTVVLIHTGSALDRHGDSHGLTHCHHRSGDCFRFAHQAGAETARLHAVTRAADVKIDFIKPRLRRPGRALRECLRVTAAQLDGQRVFSHIVAQEPLTIAMLQGAGCNHLGKQPRRWRQQAQEIPAMPIGPIQHGCDGNGTGVWLHNHHCSDKTLFTEALRLHCCGDLPLTCHTTFTDRTRTGRFSK